VRIVAGSARGRVLATPKAADRIRPTADRVRETLFNVLGQTCEGLHVLDLFAGTGALALEALSRGAAKAVLVDSGREAQGLIRQNAKALGFEGQVELLAVPVERALEVLGRRGERFELVFSDPPYRLEQAAKVLEALEAQGLLAEGAVVVVEHDKREAAPEQAGGLQRIDQRRFGDTVVSIYAGAREGR